MFKKTGDNIFQVSRDGKPVFSGTEKAAGEFPNRPEPLSEAEALKAFTIARYYVRQHLDSGYFGSQSFSPTK